LKKRSFFSAGKCLLPLQKVKLRLEEGFSSN